MRKAIQPLLCRVPAIWHADEQLWPQRVKRPNPRTPGALGTAEALQKLTRTPYQLPRHPENEPRQLQRTRSY